MNLYFDDSVDTYVNYIYKGGSIVQFLIELLMNPLVMI